jgi:large subunit ribosomal protein L29
MKIFDLRQLPEAELQDRISELREEIFNLDFQKAIRQTTDAKKFSTSRREIAQILTILRENELGIRPIDIIETQISEADESGE